MDPEQRIKLIEDISIRLLRTSDARDPELAEEIARRWVDKISS